MGLETDTAIEEDGAIQECSESKEYQLRIDEHLFRRIEKQLARLKLSDGKKHTKQAWIERAIAKKLSNSRGSKLLNPRKKYRSIKLLIEQSTSEKLDKQLLTLKKIMRGYSKKTWILDAIEEALLEEEHLLEDIISKIH